MKQLLRMGAVAMILACGTMQIRADQTNLVQTLEVQLTVMEQGAPVTNGNFAMLVPVTRTVGTARVIAALGAATGYSFSKAATITVTTPLPEGPPTFVVTDGATSVDVTGFFTYQQLSDSLESWLVNLKTGRTSWATYSVCRFMLEDYTGYPSLNLHFDVTGLAIESLYGTAVVLPGIGPANGLSATVTGTGDLNDIPGIIQGTFAFHGYTLVDVPSSPPPND